MEIYKSKYKLTEAVPSSPQGAPPHDAHQETPWNDNVSLTRRHPGIMSVYQETPWNDVSSTEVYRQTDKLIDRFSDMEFVKNFTKLNLFNIALAVKRSL